MRGTLEAEERRRQELRSPAEGRVQLHCAVGDLVEVGAALAELTSATVVAQREALSQIEETIEQMERNLVTERRWWKASEKVVRAGEADPRRAAIHRDQLAMRVAKLEVHAAQAPLIFRQHLLRLAAASGESEASLLQEIEGLARWKNLTAITLRATERGEVVAVHATNGAELVAGAAIVDIADRTQLRFVGSISAADRQRIAPDARVLVDPDGDEFDSIEAHPQPPPVGDGDGTRFDARIADPDHKLTPGTIAEAHVQLAPVLGDLVLPADCVATHNGSSVVFVRDPDQPNMALATVVTLGRREGALVVVRSGVSAGVQVARDGDRLVARDGDRVARPRSGTETGVSTARDR